MDVQALTKQRDEIDAALAQAKKDQRKDVIKQIRSTMEDHGLTVADLEKSKRGPKAAGTGAKVAPKYKHTPTGATWTGRGKTPKWFNYDAANVITLEPAETV